MNKRIVSFLLAMVMLFGLYAGTVTVYAETSDAGEIQQAAEVTDATESTDATEDTESTDSTASTESTEVTEPVDTKLTASDNCIKILKQEEGFSRTPYWDFTQYTVGYGTKCPADMVDHYTKNGITEAEAETLLRNHLIAVERDIHVRMIDRYGLELSQNQSDALVLFSYNCGTSWAYELNGTFHTAIAKGATGNDLIRAFALWCSAVCTWDSPVGKPRGKASWERHEGKP